MYKSFLKFFFYFLGGLWLSFGAFAQAPAEVKEKPIDIILGIDKVLKLDFTPNTQVQIGNESLLQRTVIPQKREITLTGQKPGKTSVIIRDNVGDIRAKYLVTITSNDQSKLVKELKDFIGDVEGLEIGVKGETVYVGGNIIVPNDIGRVVKVLSQPKFDGVLFLVELSPQTERLVARKMQDEIQKNGGLNNVTVRVVNHIYWLEGIVTSDGAKKRAEEIAKAFYPDRIATLAERTDQVRQASKASIYNFIQVNAKSQPQPIPKLVKVTAQFVELTKDFTRTFGFKWTPLLSNGSGQINFGKTNNGTVTTQSSGTLSGTISNLFPKLNSAKQAGYARVVQSGIVVVKDNVQGKITKSDTRKFALGSGQFTQAATSNASFSVTVKPNILQDEKINMKIGVTVSSIVGGNAAATQENSVSTELVVKSKDSAVVGGIVVNKTSTDYNKVPSDQVQNASPLFSFIRSKALASSKTQFVVFVTPEIIESASGSTEEIKKKFRRRAR